MIEGAGGVEVPKALFYTVDMVGQESYFFLVQVIEC